MRHIVIGNGVDLGPVNQPIPDCARMAWNVCGKGGGHAAQLNFGGSMSCAVAKFGDFPLLYKDGDFAAANVRPALAP